MNLMKSNIFFAGLALIGATLTSCDDIAEDKRTQPYQTKIEKTALVTEFSGVKCVNCPQGAAELHKLLEIYPQNLVVVSMHPTGISFTSPYKGTDLRTEASTEFWEYYQKPSSLPSAAVDGGEIMDNRAAWSPAVAAAISVSAPLTATVSCDYDETTKKVTASYDIKFTSDYSGELFAALWLTQSNIIGTQMDGTTTLTDYVHNHNLRAAFAGVFGTSIGQGFTHLQNVTGAESITLEAPVLLVDKKNPNPTAKDCDVVLVIFDKGKKVIQAAHCPVVKE